MADPANLCLAGRSRQGGAELKARALYFDVFLWVIQRFDAIDLAVAFVLASRKICREVWMPCRGTLVAMIIGVVIGIILAMPENYIKEKT